MIQENKNNSKFYSESLFKSKKKQNLFWIKILKCSRPRITMAAACQKMHEESQFRTACGWDAIFFD